jgi:ATP-dependent DNA helicase RecQ
MPLERELQDRFGYPAFRPGQKPLVEALLAGRDALGVMPTGGGKSLCFQLPAALMEGTAIVVSPLIALMKDQVDALRARGVAAEVYNSSLSSAERRSVTEALRSGSVRLLYMAPERIQADGFMELLARIPVSFLAIDEAHCISHWGHDFRPDYRRLGELRDKLRGKDPARPVPVIALTATATQRVQADILERLRMPEAVQVITGFRRTNLAFEVRKCSGRAEKFEELRTLIREAKAQGGSTVIYAATRKHVELVAGELRIPYYHAGMSDEERTEAQDRFLGGEGGALVATNAFGMGIDKSNVRVVAHYDIPGSVEAYYQEAGRAGRDGHPARCVLLFNHADVATQEFFIEQTERQAEVSTEDQLALLKQLVRYAYAKTCRQHMILRYFGDPEADSFERCGLCDRCAPAHRERAEAPEDVALASRQTLAAVARLNGRFGKTRICELLKGSENAALKATGLQSQSTYGLLAKWTLDDVRDLVDVLVDDDYLRISGIDYPVLSISPTGVAAMKGQEPLLLSRVPEGAIPPKRRKPATGSAGPEAKNGVAGDVDTALLDALKEFRRKEAQKKSVPPYVVFHDKTLSEVASRLPLQLDELSKVSGFGPKKLELYGEQILTLVRERAGPA